MLREATKDEDVGKAYIDQKAAEDDPIMSDKEEEDNKPKYNLENVVYDHVEGK